MMRRLGGTVLAVLGLTGAALFADTPNQAFEIWPKDGIPLFKEGQPPESVQPMRDDLVRIVNVSVPMAVVTKVPGAERPTPAVVICPGGGYRCLAWNHEGVEVAEWLKDRGIAGVILKYRIPDQRDGALADAQRTIRWVRAKAAEFNIDPARVGIMGFSAGANLTVRAATGFKTPAYAAVDEIDRESCRPDFQLPIYPWDLLERNNPDTPWKGHHGIAIRTADYPVDADTPPAFIVQSEDDFCRPETALGYYAALKAAGVKAELHVYERGGHGGHGYGVRRLGFPTDAWPALAETWLRMRLGL